MASKAGSGKPKGGASSANSGAKKGLPPPPDLPLTKAQLKEARKAAEAERLSLRDAMESMDLTTPSPDILHMKLKEAQLGAGLVRDSFGNTLTQKERESRGREKEIEKERREARERREAKAAAAAAAVAAADGNGSAAATGDAVATATPNNAATDVSHNPEASSQPAPAPAARGGKKDKASPLSQEAELAALIDLQRRGGKLSNQQLKVCP